MRLTRRVRTHSEAGPVKQRNTSRRFFNPKKRKNYKINNKNEYIYTFYRSEILIENIIWYFKNELFHFRSTHLKCCGIWNCCYCCFWWWFCVVDVAIFYFYKESRVAKRNCHKVGEKRIRLLYIKKDRKRRKSKVTKIYVKKSKKKSNKKSIFLYVICSGLIYHLKQTWHFEEKMIDDDFQPTLLI